MKKRTYAVKEKLFLWSGENAAWHFVYIGKNDSEIIKKQVAGTMPFDKAQGKRRGFGAVKVEVKLGSSKWKTSIFPTKEGPYILPIKASVRAKEMVANGDMLEFTITLQ